MNMKTINTLKPLHSLGISSAVLAAAVLFSTGCNSTPEAPKTASAAATMPPKDPVTITPDSSDPHHAWTETQILTCTVSQCWQLSGKNESSFFDIVQQLSAIAAKDRDLTIPETEAAGKQTGEYIKAQARKDHDQLLYAIVDAAIRKVGTPTKQAN